MQIHSHLACPQTLAEALARADSLLTDEEKEVIRTRPLSDVGWMLHMTLGHKLRNALGLWTPSASALYDDINRQMPDCFAIDGDTASAALISAMWFEQHGFLAWH